MPVSRGSGPDASNSCLPMGTSPVIVSVPPVPSCTRGERCPLTTTTGAANDGATSTLLYAANKFVVARSDVLLDNKTSSPSSASVALVYRGHGAPVTAVAMAKSGAYCCSGDEKGNVRVWAYDHPDHLSKYAAPILSGPIRDVAWDAENKRLAVAGERAGNDASGACGKAILWDTGNSVGQLGLHLKGRAASIAYKPQRPYRIVTAGKDDSKLLLHQGPPFAKVPVDPDTKIPTEHAHSKGAVHCVRYSHNGQWVASVGTDRSIAIYNGKTLELKHRLEHIHTATVYCCAWSNDDASILTASGDGTCKLLAVNASTGALTELKTWKPAETQAGNGSLVDKKVPAGGVQLGCAFLKDHTPVSVGYNGQISILNNKNGENSNGHNGNNDIRVITGHYAPIADLSIDETHSVFYTGDTDGILCQWDLETCQPIQRLEPPTSGNNGNNNKDLMYIVHSGAISGVATVAANKSSSRLYSVGWDDKLYVSIDGVVGGTTTTSDPVSLGAQPSAIAAGTEIAVIVTVNGLLVVNKHGQPGDMVSIPYEAQAVAVSADDKTAYVGGKDNKIHVYDIDSSSSSLSEKYCIDNGHLKPIHALALSHDGTKLASADEKDICVWDVVVAGDGNNNGHCYKPIVARGKWCFHVQRVTTLSWSPDDQVIASGGADDSIYLWNLQSKMKRVHYPFAHRGGVVRVAFLNNNNNNNNNANGGGGLKLLSVGVDSVVNLWDVSKDVKAKFG